MLEPISLESGKFLQEQIHTGWNSLCNQCQNPAPLNYMSNFCFPPPLQWRGYAHDRPSLPPRYISPGKLIFGRRKGREAETGRPRKPQLERPAPKKVRYTATRLARPPEHKNVSFAENERDCVTVLALWIYATAGKGCPYRLDGSLQLDSTFLILSIDGREVQAANLSIFLQQHCHLANNCRT